jgi:hypothetical protein
VLATAIVFGHFAAPHCPAHGLARVGKTVLDILETVAQAEQPIITWILLNHGNTSIHCTAKMLYFCCIN